MQVPKWTTIDFETFRINPRPRYPPKPVGVAIKRPGQRRGTYYAWGHPTQNNCSETEGLGMVRDLFNGTDPLLFQEAKFDVEVAVKHIRGCRMPDWRRTHDSKYMIFMHNPHAPSLSLKPSAQRILGIAPEEQDELKEWILTNIPEARRKPSEWGAYIALAPGKLVGRYAVGDVYRTDALGVHLFKYLDEHNMLDAYDRERRLMPVMLKNEQEGIRVDLDKLSADIPVLQAAVTKAHDWLRKRLKAPGLNVNSDKQFAQALIASGVVPEENFVVTGKGNLSTSKKNLTPAQFKDKRVYQAHSYASKLDSYVNMFALPWQEIAGACGGTVHTSWRQVKGSGVDGDGGARSGRAQSTPNFQNISKAATKKDANYSHPDFLNVPNLPLMRTYFIPDSKDHVWGRRDYNQQELRVLAHFEAGPLLQHYLEDPRYDFHSLILNGYVERFGRPFERDAVKIDNFSDIYGAGLEKKAATLGVTVDMARELQKAKRAILPGVAELEKAIKDSAKAGDPICTWGGREYFCEPPMYVERLKRKMTFEYKLLNYLIQGSASDCTKEALIRYDEHPKREGRMLVPVHDEINTSAHKKVFKREMAVLREVMQSVEFDIPMLSDGEYGPNWGSLQKFAEPKFNMKAWKEWHGNLARA